MTDIAIITLQMADIGGSSVIYLSKSHRLGKVLLPMPKPRQAIKNHEICDC
jgi:hypothetical protein